MLTIHNSPYHEPYQASKISNLTPTLSLNNVSVTAEPNTQTVIIKARSCSLAFPLSAALDAAKPLNVFSLATCPSVS